MEDSFASFNSPENNFSKFAYLKVGGETKDGYNNELSKALLKFNLNNINSIDDISKIELDLYVKDITSEKDNVTIGIYINKDRFWHSDVNWSNSPEIDDRLGTFTINKESRNSYISVDITSIALNWLMNNIDNNGITLLAEGRGEKVIFVSSRGYNAPVIKVHYNNDRIPICYEEDCRKDLSDTEYKQFMLITAKDSRVLEMGQTITFDSDKKVNGIRYMDNGEIIFSKSGKYLINFWMNCKNESKINDRLGVNLIKYTSGDSHTTVLKAMSNEPIDYGRSTIIASTCKLDVSCNDIYKFINSSDNNIRLSSINTEYGASVVITKIE